MTDTASTEPEPTREALHLSPRDEARLRLAMDLDLLVDNADHGIPVRPETAPGDLLRHALGLQSRVNRLVESAVVAERERGTTWDQIGEAAGITRQAAHERWRGAVRAWATTGRTCLPPSVSHSSLEYATMVDESYAQRHPDEPRAVSGGLDANRFPGSREYEHSLRSPGAALHARLADLATQFREVSDEYHRLVQLDDHGPLAENRDRAAEIEEERARVFDQLVTSEPSLADDHRAEADYHRNAAEGTRAYARRLRSDYKDAS
ncbi:hypothetical protein [Streptomyces misionensis]|uniref:hypothetical protein n=1 Tax=Streptomyces misionensis TaxID=67331 RepID=UPI0033CF8B42